MDGSQFDQLARSPARGRTRRGFLGGLSALAIGLTGVRTATAACPPGRYLGSGNRCLCKRTGRPPLDGACPCPAGQTHRVEGGAVCAGRAIGGSMIASWPDCSTSSAECPAGWVCSLFTPGIGAWCLPICDSV